MINNEESNVVVAKNKENIFIRILGKIRSIFQ